MVETIFISALALVFILEGLLPFAFPTIWRKVMMQAITMEEKQLRIMGFVSICIGMFVLFLFT